jgi:hypothetical protein
MSKSKISSIDEKIAQFGESTTALLTDIHTKKKGGDKGASKKGRKKKKIISIPDPDIDLIDEGSLRIDSKQARMA